MSCHSSRLLEKQMVFSNLLHYPILSIFKNSLSNKYKSRGFNVLAFPSNEFNQELDTNAEILQYVNDHFPEVMFPIFSRGSLADSEVFKLCKEMTGEPVEWNFHKYLVNGKGQAVKSYGHRTQPMAIDEDIVALMKETDGVRLQRPVVM